MNWTKILIAAVVAGVVRNLADFVMHAVIMGSTYARYPEVFSQEEANPLWFFLVAIAVAIPATILFAKTRSSWPAGMAGGLRFGFWLGMVAFFTSFYPALVIDGFPYFLSWCWGGIDLIGYTILGGVIGAIYSNGAKTPVE